MKSKKTKWNKILDNKNVIKFIQDHDINVWYETATGENCIIMEDGDYDPFLIRITDSSLGHFDILSGLTYLSFDIGLIARIYNEVKKSFYRL